MFERFIKFLQMEILAQFLFLTIVWHMETKKLRKNHLPAWHTKRKREKVEQIKLMKALGNQIILVDYS